MSEKGTLGFYSHGFFSDYFPGFLYFLLLIGEFFKSINVSINSLQFEFSIKFLSNIFDFLTALYIYKIISIFNKKFRNFAVALYLLNPAVIFNSSIWGQTDSIFTFFLVVSSYLLLKKRESLSSVSAALSFIIKPQSAPFFPIYLFYFLKNFKKKVLIPIFVLPLTILILSLPFFGRDFFGIFSLLKKSSEVYPYNSIFAFNLWAVFGWWQKDKWQIAGVILYLFSLFLIIYPLIKKELKPGLFFISSSLSFLSFYLFMTRMHERYLFPFLVFVLISAFILKSKKILFLYILTSIVHFINLWYVYYYYQFVYKGLGVYGSFSYGLYVFINDNYKIFSITTLVLFFVMLKFYYQLVYVKKAQNFSS